MAKRTRREWLLAAGACLVGDLATPWTAAFGQAESIQERMARAMEEDTEQVNRLYSIKPVRVILGSREWVIPANYFGPKGEGSPDTFMADKYFGFVLFLPDYGGYTKENWSDPFDRRQISILNISSVDKTQVVVFSDGHHEIVSPANYGEPTAQFQNWRRMLEDKPLLDVYGLEGYRPKYGKADVTWTGTRSNGEFFFFRSHLAPGESTQKGTNPLCDVRYYSEKEDLFIAYMYSNDHLAQWREIDDAIWSKLHEWRVA
jgi:hypothetical protein